LLSGYPRFLAFRVFVLRLRCWATDLMQDREKDRLRLRYTADRLVEHIAGKPAVSPTTREACRKLGVLLLRAVFPDVATTFRLSPRENGTRIEDVLRSMYYSDPEARSLIAAIAQPEPPAKPENSRARVERARQPVGLVYEDFLIRFGPPQDGLFPLWAHSPAGNQQGWFRIPACLVQPAVSGMTRDVCGLAPCAGDTVHRDDLAGSCLFEALFTKPILGLLAQLPRFAR
jgi:hypothetical protein